MTIEIKAKTQAGHVQTFRVDEIIEIDGKAYGAAGIDPDVVATLNHLDGRLTALENSLGAAFQKGTAHNTVKG